MKTSVFTSRLSWPAQSLSIAIGFCLLPVAPVTAQDEPVSQAPFVTQPAAPQRNGMIANPRGSTATAPATTPTAEKPVVAAKPLPPPTAQAYVEAQPPARMSYGHMMVPLSFLTKGIGASAGSVQNFTRLIFFNHTVEIYPYQRGARVNGQNITLLASPQNIDGQLYIPWAPLAEAFGIRWRLIEPAAPSGTLPSQSTLNGARKTVFLLQYPAAYVEEVRSSVGRDRVRVVLKLSNPTRIIATQQGLDVRFHLAAARRAHVPAVSSVNDYLVARAVTSSGDWRARFTVRINYSAPVQWFTLGNPPRLVVDVQRLFEERNTNSIVGGLAMTKIRRGTASGPVQMYVVRVDPQDGWRMKVAPGGYSVLQRNRPSKLADKHKALVAVNGGFFAYDGAAVGAVLVDKEWIRLPWKGRTAIGFWPDGQARIGNLQTNATVDFSNGLRIPIRDLNGWPDVGKVTALTRRFGNYYRLRPGEIAIAVKNDEIVAKPGSGGVAIHPDGFTLIASGGAKPWLDKVARGMRAHLSIQAAGWNGLNSALGGGPRLLQNSQVQVTALREAFREDVRVGRGPRTAFGIDSQGRYIILVVDGRQPYFSVGMTLTELAFTMQQLGARDALNLDGGGSTVMAVKNRIVNRPSDGRERGVSNALLVMR